MVTRHYLRRRVRVALSSLVAALLLICFAAPSLHAQNRVVAARTIDTIDSPEEAVDVGQLPVSQPMHLTLRLQATPERQAALDQLLAAQITQTAAEIAADPFLPARFEVGACHV